jgi:hypothetical protein
MGKNVTMGYDGRVIWGAAQDGSAISTNTPVVGYLDMLMRDHASFQIDTGTTAIPASTLVGNLVVLCSDNYVPPGGGTGQVPYVGTWSPVPTTILVSNGGLAIATNSTVTVTTVATFGTGVSKGVYYIPTVAVRWLQFTFTQSAGSGVLTVSCNAKSLGG